MSTNDTSTYDTFLKAAQGYVQSNGSWFTPEAVAQRAADQKSCVWHAANSLVLDHMDEAGYGSCVVCGGVTAPNQDNLHSMCRVRQDRGLPTPVLDSSPKCHCYSCEKG